MLICAPAYVLVPVVMSIFLVIYLSVAGSSPGIQDFIYLACDLGVKAEFGTINASEEINAVTDACTQSYMYNVRHETVWAIVRCGLQVPHPILCQCN